jgi:hypothetical protein
LAILFSLSVASVTAQVQVVRADINGNQIHMYLDHDSLQSFVNQVATFMGESSDSFSSDGNDTDLEWSDVLANGNNPRRNVNYSGFSVFGIDSLTSTGVLIADSLILNKDADITGKLSVGEALVVAGATADFRASGAISLDAGFASNFTTTAGALTLEGASGVTVTSTGGTMALNGAGQTVDLDATTIDVDATTITVDATTTTFTGDVKGPRSTGDDEFVTYGQLDSLANTAPFNETYKVFKVPGGINQAKAGSASPGTTERVDLLNSGNSNGYFAELSEAAENPVDITNQPYAIQSAPGHHMNLTDAGMYEYSLTIELQNTSATDAFVTVEVQNRDVLEEYFTTTRTLASDSEVVHGIGAFGETGSLSHHLNSSMSFEANNDNEDIQIEITVLPAGTTIEIVSYSFSVSRVGEE